MANWQISRLDKRDPDAVAACVSMLVGAFNEPSRYSEKRLNEEITADDSVFYREYFVSSVENRIVGFGGVKAADWASHTHILYLSAVAREYRGLGMGRALLHARLSWLQCHFTVGSVLVSSRHPKRFQALGFKPVVKDEIDGLRLFIKHL